MTEMVAARPGRLELAERAQTLRAAGWPLLDIGKELGISRGYASELVLDPTGEKSRARKLSYRGTCERCGGPTSGGDGPRLAPRHCSNCARQGQHEARRWRPDVIVEAIRGFADEHGRQPTANDWLYDREPGYPDVGVVQREFGSWANAVEAAGFPRPHVGHKLVRKQLVCVECGEPFQSVQRTTRFCSKRCYARSKRASVERDCRDCGNTFVLGKGQGQAWRVRCYECSPPGSGPGRRWQAPSPIECNDCGVSFLRRPQASQRKRCYDCQPQGVRRSRSLPRLRDCVACGVTFAAVGPGAHLRKRCYDCQPVGALTRSPTWRPAAGRHVVCVDCGGSFTTRNGHGQHSRRRCYDCLPLSTTGQSQSTLRRRAREVAAA